MGKGFLWAFLFLSVTSIAVAADPPPSVTIPNSNTTYIPPSAQNSAAVQSAQGQVGASKPTIVVPTPETIPPPSITVAPTSNGQYRNAKLEVNISKMFLDRYKESVVRVTARDLAGNELAKAMGVGVGKNSQFIATPLSIVLGNSQQWADQIEITHASGNKYFANVALIDEERNLVLLAPEANPAPITFTREQDERPQITVFTISFQSDPLSGLIEPAINKGQLAAASIETGVFSVSGRGIDDAQAGTAVINSNGELVGMLLPGGRGVLSSTLQKLIAKAQQTKAIEPGFIGAILGRGVLVDTKIPGAFRTINSAIEAIKKGEAPKADTARYTPAKNRALAPKQNDKVVIKVMPGTYKEGKTISLPSNISLAGSGVADTHVIGSDPNKPVILIQNSSNVMISGMRIVPAALQNMKAPTVIISKSQDITMLGNIVEAKGGVGIWAHEAKGAKIYGSSFPKGEARAVSCDRSSMEIEANSFLGGWPTALSLDKNCSAEVRRNLFFENKVGVIASTLSSRVKISQNTFIRNGAAVKNAGEGLSFEDNIFYESTYAISSAVDIDARRLGRNSVWKSKIMNKGRQMRPLDIIRTEPQFEDPEVYDFRVKAGRAQSGTGTKDSGSDIGAYQRTDLLGRFNQQYMNTLGVAVGDDDLRSSWGLQ